MRIKPREQILGVWRSLLTACYRDETWVWGGINGSNSISDAEQVLCLLYPATELEGFGLDNPDAMADDVAETLSLLGGVPSRDSRRLGEVEMRADRVLIGRTLLGVLESYYDRHAEVTRADPDTGEILEEVPIFAVSSYLASSNGIGPNADQLRLDVVDSYSMSLTLCLASLKFLRGLHRSSVELGGPIARRTEVRIALLEKRVKTRLTAAMIGLVRSFVVSTFTKRSPEAQAMLSMLNQTGAAPDTVVNAVLTRLERVRNRLRNDLTLSKSPEADLYDDNQLFECGWSWGIVAGATPIDFVDMDIAAQPGIAVARPYLHFTVVALDGINDLTSVRTRELDLLDAEQRRLAEALQLRWELAQRYWAAVARFGPGRWPLEDIPWRTTDGEESDYFSLTVSAVLMQDLQARQADDDDLNRAAPIFDELARRGRIISRFTESDSARLMHSPGLSLRLHGTAGVADGPLLCWTVSDYATVLLKRTLQAANLSGTMETRDVLLRLAQSIMDHLDNRSFRGGPVTGLWDDPTRIFGGDAVLKPSWYFTERMVECLVAAAHMYQEPPIRPPNLVIRAQEMLTEAEHLLNRKLLELDITDTSATKSAVTASERRLSRAREIIDELPGTALSLATQSLLDLDELAYARYDADRME